MNFLKIVLVIDKKRSPTQRRRYNATRYSEKRRIKKTTRSINTRLRYPNTSPTMAMPLPLSPVFRICASATWPKIMPTGPKRSEVMSDNIAMAFVDFCELVSGVVVVVVTGRGWNVVPKTKAVPSSISCDV